MPGPRQPTAVLEANGRKHLTRAEADARHDLEVRVPKPTTIKVPSWLDKDLRTRFRKLAHSLLDVNLYTELDADTLGRYVVAHAQFISATTKTREALAAEQLEEASDWSKLQDLYFKQARGCAQDLGLTVSARCRLVIPDGMRKLDQTAPSQREAEDGFLLRLRARQAAGA